jgi:hypothetical protein
MMASRCLRWYLMAAALLLADTSDAMGSAETGSRDLSFREAPYWVTFTIPESRDALRNRPVGRGEFSGGHIIGGIGYTPPGGGPPYSPVVFRVYDRYNGNDGAVTLPIKLTLQEFVAEYNAHESHFNPRSFNVQFHIGDVSAVRFGDRTWFKFKVIRGSVYSFQYWTPLDEKKMLGIDWLPPRNTFLHRNREAKKRPEIESILASIKISIQP